MQRTCEYRRVMKQAFGPMMNLPIEMSDTTLNDRLLLKTARGCEFLLGAIDNSIEGRKKPLFLAERVKREMFW